MRVRGVRLGFTLVEMLVAIGIVAVLVAIAYPIFSASRQRAKASNCEAKLEAIAGALREFRQDQGYFPECLCSLKDRYVGDPAASHCSSDPQPLRNTYDLFYARRGAREDSGAVTLACALHGHRGMMMRLDGTVERVEFQTASLSGGAQVMRRDALDFRSYDGKPLNPGDTVLTTSGTATLTFDDGSRCEVGPDTQVNVCALVADRDGCGSHVLLYLSWGEIVNDVESILTAGSTYEIATPSVVAGVRGTRFSVKVDKLTYRTSVNVYQGEVTVATAQGGTSNLPAGTSQSFAPTPVDGGGGDTGGGGGDDKKEGKHRKDKEKSKKH